MLVENQKKRKSIKIEMCVSLYKKLSVTNMLVYICLLLVNTVLVTTRQHF
jgi:hypothetical protein